VRQPSPVPADWKSPIYFARLPDRGGRCLGFTTAVPAVPTARRSVYDRTLVTLRCYDFGIRVEAPAMASPFISTRPVPIFEELLPERFRLPKGKHRQVLANIESSLPCAPYITSLCYCVRRCDMHAVTIEAWFGWADCPPEATRCYLTQGCHRGAGLASDGRTIVATEKTSGEAPCL